MEKEKNVILNVNEKTRIIRLDERNLSIDRLKVVEVRKGGVKTGEKKEKWLNDGYFSTVESALNKIIDNIDSQEANDIKAYITYKTQKIREICEFVGLK